MKEFLNWSSVEVWHLLVFVFCPPGIYCSEYVLVIVYTVCCSGRESSVDVTGLQIIFCLFLLSDEATALQVMPFWLSSVDIL